MMGGLNFVPNGNVSGVEGDHIAEPDVSQDNPFGDGVEDGDREGQALPQSSYTSGNFHVEEPIEAEEDEPIRIKMPVIDNVDDPSITQELELPDTLEDLDDQITVTGEEWETFYSDPEDDNFVDDVYVDDGNEETFSDLDVDITDFDLVFNPDLDLEIDDMS